MSKIRVLIADNSRDFAALLSLRLSMNADIEIVGFARDGAETIELVRQIQPDVLLLDIVMPGMDGLEVLKRLKTAAHRPVVFIISALGSEQLTRQTFSLGADSYFVKPLNTESLISRILDCAQPGYVM